jgi:hypothetical protein
MFHKSMTDLFNGICRVKWWRYRYVFVAVLLVNIFVAHHFLFDQSIADLNPFRSPPGGSEAEAHHPPPPPPPPPPNKPAKPKKPAEPEKVPTPPTKPEKPAKPSKAATPPTEPEKPAKPSKAATPPTGPEKPAKPANSATKAEKPAKPSKAAEPSKPTNIAVPVTPVPPPESSATFNLHDYDFNGEYVGWPLERVCKESKFTPGLVYVCDNNSGGIGNIRNFILTCIRYAIDAGASGLIMPRIQRRSEDKLENLFTASFQPFDYFFDEKHFRTVIGKYCPQMVIYDTPKDIPNADKRIEATEFYPKDLNNGGDGCDDRGINRHLDQFRAKHDAWLHRLHQYPNATVPVTIRFRWATFFEWPIYRDGPEFATTFGAILRIRPDIEDLAAITLDEMANFIHGNSEGRSKREKLDAPYLGVHLRTENDALGFWPKFEIQTKGYLQEARLRGLKHAYIATGNTTEGHRFGDQADKELGMKVVGKTDLLKGDDLKRLNDLSWDQQALVDFLVLAKSAHFTGCSFSSFTMNIAIKRHSMTEGIRTRQWKSPGDVYSTLVGRFDNWFGDWMFMYECMWP